MKNFEKRKLLLILSQFFVYTVLISFIKPFILSSNFFDQLNFSTLYVLWPFLITTPKTRVSISPSLIGLAMATTTAKFYQTNLRGSMAWMNTISRTTELEQHVYYRSHHINRPSVIKYRILNCKLFAATKANIIDLRPAPAEIAQKEQRDFECQANAILSLRRAHCIGWQSSSVVGWCRYRRHRHCTVQRRAVHIYIPTFAANHGGIIYIFALHIAYAQNGQIIMENPARI